MVHQWRGRSTGAYRVPDPFARCTYLDALPVSVLANETSLTQGGGVVDLPDTDELAVAHGEVLGDSKRAEPGHIHESW